MRAEPVSRGLIVLADGAQAAFAAGAVAELARAGATWRTARGAGLGGHLAVLAVLGEAEEAERRWRRQAEQGCPLLRPRIRTWREREGREEGFLVLPDALNLGGWLDPVELTEFLAPEAAGLPERLRRRAGRCAVAVHDLSGGELGWTSIEDLDPREAVELLAASACFPGGWPPLEVDRRDGPARLWGGVAAVPSGGVSSGPEIEAWDLVCGFPVPVTRRPGDGRSLFELVQLRDEARCAALVDGWLAESGGRLRLVAPGQGEWAMFAGRDGADLGLEYPLPWEHNGALAGIVLEFGRFAVQHGPGAVGC